MRWLWHPIMLNLTHNVIYVSRLTRPLTILSISISLKSQNLLNDSRIYFTIMMCETPPSDLINTGILKFEKPNWIKANHFETDQNLRKKKIYSFTLIYILTAKNDIFSYELITQVIFCTVSNEFTPIWSSFLVSWIIAFWFFFQKLIIIKGSAWAMVNQC